MVIEKFGSNIVTKIKLAYGKLLGKRNLSKENLISKEHDADKKLLQDRINANVKYLRNILIPILKKYNVKKAGIFGSYAEGKNKKNSDVDILVTPPVGAGFDFMDIEDELAASLNKKIDLVTYKGLSPHLKKKILNQEIRII